MHLPLGDKVCVVTGATGIAAATASLCSRQGASVFIVSKEPGDAEALAGRLAAEGGRAGWAHADLRDEAATEAAFAAAVDRFGRIDGLAAVAGGSGRRFGDGPLHTLSAEAWAATFDLNTMPAFLAVRSALRAMLDGGAGGSIVIVSSVLADHPSPRLFATHAYASAKGAAIAMMRTAAAHYAPRGIRVNAVAPGLVDTPMAERAMTDPATLAYAAVKQPVSGGPLRADDVAAPITFLLGDAATGITGQIVGVDGGWAVSEPPPTPV